jgi:hypothetical protein
MSVGAKRPLGAVVSPAPAAATPAAPRGHDTASWLCDRRSVEVVALRHPILEALGHQPTSDYAEQFWLPTIGPSALWTHRRMNAGFVGGKESYSLDLADLGREIGLGAGTGRNSMIVRTVTRLVDFHLAEILDGRLGVSTMLPPLTRRQATHLPEQLATRHQELARCGSRGLSSQQEFARGGSQLSAPSPTRTSSPLGLER